MGGYVMLELWRQRPDLVRGLAMCNTKAEADTPQARDAREVMAALALAEGSAAVAARMMGKMFHPTRYASGGLASGLEARVEAMMRACPPQTIAAACLAMRDRADFAPRLGEIDVPARVIVGDADALIPRELAGSTAQRLPRGRWVVVPRTGHLSCIEDPGAVACALESLAGEVFG
jgi:pimeloyl-ACP methyl ester carboxylesterase